MCIPARTHTFYVKQQIEIERQGHAGVLSLKRLFYGGEALFYWLFYLTVTCVRVRVRVRCGGLLLVHTKQELFSKNTTQEHHVHEAQGQDNRWTATSSSTNYCNCIAGERWLFVSRAVVYCFEDFVALSQCVCVPVPSPFDPQQLRFCCFPFLPFSRTPKLQVVVLLSPVPILQLRILRLLRTLRCHQQQSHRGACSQS